MPEMTARASMRTPSCLGLSPPCWKRFWHAACSQSSFLRQNQSSAPHLPFSKDKKEKQPSL
jgi:hypothetical protein